MSSNIAEAAAEEKEPSATAATATSTETTTTVTTAKSTAADRKSLPLDECVISVHSTMTQGQSDRILASCLAHHRRPDTLALAFKNAGVRIVSDIANKNSKLFDASSSCLLSTSYKPNKMEFSPDDSVLAVQTSSHVKELVLLNQIFTSSEKKIFTATKQFLKTGSDCIVSFTWKPFRSSSASFHYPHHHHQEGQGEDDEKSSTSSSLSPLLAKAPRVLAIAHYSSFSVWAPQDDNDISSTFIKLNSIQDQSLVSIASISWSRVTASSGSGGVIATANNRNQLKLWCGKAVLDSSATPIELEKSRPISIHDSTCVVRSLCFTSENDGILASIPTRADSRAMKDARVLLFDSNSRCVLTSSSSYSKGISHGAKSYVTSVSFCPLVPGIVFTVGSDASIRSFSVKVQQQQQTVAVEERTITKLLPGLREAKLYVCEHNDGNLIAISDTQVYVLRNVFFEHRYFYRKILLLLRYKSNEKSKIHQFAQLYLACQCCARYLA